MVITGYTILVGLANLAMQSHLIGTAELYLTLKMSFELLKFVKF